MIGKPMAVTVCWGKDGGFGKQAKLKVQKFEKRLKCAFCTNIEQSLCHSSSEQFQHLKSLASESWPRQTAAQKKNDYYLLVIIIIIHYFMLY